MASEFFTLDGSDITYANWDAGMTTFCVCDWGFTGADCSLKLCPKGDDPVTQQQTYRKVQLAIGATSGSINGTVTLRFLGDYTTLNAKGNETTDSDCEDAFESLGNIKTVSCNQTAVDSMGGATYDITIKAWPDYPFENNLFYHSGNPSLSYFLCDTTDVNGAEGVYCNFTNINNSSDIKEYVSCSNRGVCDLTSGTCDCFSEVSGVSCDEYSGYVEESSADVLSLVASNDSFGSDIIHLSTSAPLSSSLGYNFIYAEADGEKVWDFNSEGQLEMWQEGIYVYTGGVTISGGGLRVEYDGLTVEDGGLIVEGTATVEGLYIGTEGITISTGGLSIQDGGATISVDSYTDSVLTLDGYDGYESSILNIKGYSTSKTYELIKTQDNGASIFTVYSDPLTQIDQGGLVLYGGETISTGGLLIEAGGLTVEAGGASITAGVTIQSSGLVITAGGQTITAGGLALTGGLTVQNSGMLLTGGMTVYDSGILLTGGMTVKSGGLIVTGGLSVNSDGMSIKNGLNVTNGGLTVFNGGMYLTGGLTLNSDGLVVSGGGIDIESGGMSVTGGLTVQDSGLLVSAGGLSVSAGGILLTGGLSVYDSGLDVTGGLSVESDGLSVAGGLTVSDSGVSIQAGGLDLTGGLSVEDSGLSVTGGLTVYSSGVVISSGGETVSSGNLVVSTGDLQVTAGDLIVTAGSLTVGTDITYGSSISQSSDIRLKDVISYIDGVLPKMKELHVINFKWNDVARRDLQLTSSQSMVGLIAQEVEQVFPDMVETSASSGYKQVKYSSLSPLLVQAINELQQKMEERDAQIETLQRQLASLHAKIGGSSESEKKKKKNILN